MQPSKRTHKSSDGRGVALSYEPGHRLRDALVEFRKLNSREARASFADTWLAIWARDYEFAWPMIYELMHLVEEQELYKDPRKLPGVVGPGGKPEFAEGFASFREYFEARVKRPFALWAELEQTHHFVSKYAPELIEKTYSDVQIERAAHNQAADAKDRANQRPAGRPAKLETLDANSADVKGFPSGNAAAYALRRLRKDRPGIHARVLAGELTANAGMIEAGFRKKRPSKRKSALEKIQKLWATLDKAGRREHLRWTLKQCAICGREGAVDGTWCDACCEEGMRGA